MPPGQLNRAIQWMMVEPDPVEEALEFLSDSKLDEPKNTRGPSKNRNRYAGANKLEADYFCLQRPRL
ncbi:hypothetical protein VP01_1370g6 [Puccinia sorghi]|uniref:Uncharacterized protein n=1 Tax=Puccinia sorghi TaxID=27349 RepID=A0A0L6VLP0_9BASI|nr:hypothetical protein VP01_1370g6 [Puccinia sorghi]